MGHVQKFVVENNGECLELVDVSTYSTEVRVGYMEITCQNLNQN